MIRLLVIRAMIATIWSKTWQQVAKSAMGMTREHYVTQDSGTNLLHHWERWVSAWKETGTETWPPREPRG